MKVKTLLKTLKGVEYDLVAESGWLIKSGYVSERGYEDDCIYEDWKIVSITTLSFSGNLYITIK